VEEKVIIPPFPLVLIVGVIVNVTGPVKVTSPFAVTLPPRLIVPAVTDKEDRGELPPTALFKVTVPAPAVNITVGIELKASILANEMLAPFEVIVQEFVVTLMSAMKSSSGLDPSTVMLPPTTIPCTCKKTRFVKGTEFPTLPPKVIFPPVPASKVNLCAPFTV
jgi:hypothetical protein